MKKNAYYKWLTDDTRAWTRTLNVPAEAIREAGFNVKNPVFADYVDENHIRLTQNGSSEDIVRTINGWETPNGNKQYRLGVQRLFNEDVNMVVLVPNRDYNYIDIIGTFEYA